MLPSEFVLYNQCALRKVFFDTQSKKHFSVPPERGGKQRAVSGRHSQFQVVWGRIESGIDSFRVVLHGLGKKGEAFQHS
jgi:hypothetical protein